MHTKIITFFIFLTSTLSSVAVPPWFQDRRCILKRTECTGAYSHLCGNLLAGSSLASGGVIVTDPFGTKFLWVTRCNYFRPKDEAIEHEIERKYGEDNSPREPKSNRSSNSLNDHNENLSIDDEQWMLDLIQSYNALVAKGCISELEFPLDLTVLYEVVTFQGCMEMSETELLTEDF